MIEAGHCRSHINKNVSRIKRMFKWAVEEELVPGEVATALWAVAGLKHGRTEARETVPITPVDDATVKATLEHLPEVVADMVRFQRLTGCRPEEVCQVRPMDVVRSADVWLYRPQSHKTQHFGRERTVFIGPQAQGILLKYLERNATDYCFRPSDSEAKRRAQQHRKRQTPLSCGNRPGTNRKHDPRRKAGERYDVSAYRRAIHRGCDRAFPWPQLAGRKLATLTDAEKSELAKWRSTHRWSPNRLRHAAATEIRKTYGLEAAQVVLGHATVTMTEVYAERDHALAARVAREVG